MVLLGLGNDGHIASLFPSMQEYDQNNAWVLNTKAPDIYPVKERITLSLSAINSAQHILMLVSGNEKKNVLKEIFSDKPNRRYPALLLDPKESLSWYINKE